LAVPGNRWPRQSRLLRRGAFEAVYRSGRRRVSPQFVIYYRANQAQHSRFGISVKKELGGAVVRNHIRRRIREILRQQVREIPTGWDIVVHPRALAGRPGGGVGSAPNKQGRAEFSRLSEELVRLLRSALQ
jgi:ribonuclease P protein component